MSLSIYKFSAQYITRARLSGWQVECTPNPLVWGSNLLRSKRRRHCGGTIAHWLHCSAFDFRWPALTMRYIGKNRRYITRYHRFLGIYPEISSDQYFSMKYRRTDISPWNVVSIPSNTWYFGDISPKYHNIFLLSVSTIMHRQQCGCSTTSLRRNTTTKSKSESTSS